MPGLSSERREGRRSAGRLLSRLRGRWRAVPPARRLIFDLLYFTKRIPSQALTRHANIAGLLESRRNAGVRISWSVLFLKAYAILSARHTVLRRMYMRWPLPHLYEQPSTIGRMTISRIHDGDDRVFFSRMISAEKVPLQELQQQLERYRTAPVATVGDFRRQVKISHLPVPVRRLLWWIALNVSGLVRSVLFGTFSITTVSGQDVISVHPPSISPTTATYGPIANSGDVQLSIVYDHRIMDGATVAGFLNELESILNGPVADELRQLTDSAHADRTPEREKAGLLAEG